jgi:hypothetical protein
MPDPARVAQAQILEIPVTIQGAKAVDGTERRELFTESAKTTLTFDNGALLNLRTKVTPGQSLFLRNEQSGQEILCKVLEAPPEGQIGYTDLEFTETAPAFWGDPEKESEWAEEIPQAAAEKSEAATAVENPEPAKAEPEPAVETPEGRAEAEASDENSLAMMGATASENPQPAAAESEAAAEKPQARAEIEAPDENSLAMMSATASEQNVPLPPVPEKPKGPPREELVPAHEMVPVTPPAPATTVPTGEQIDAALQAMVGASARDAADPNDAKDKENLAALMQREARLAKYAALREKAAAEIGRSPSSRGASKSAEGVEGTEGTDEAGELEILAPKVPLSELLTTGKNAVIVEIVACIAIVIALVFIYRAVSVLFVHPGDQMVAASPAPRAAPPRVPPPIVVKGPAGSTAKVSAAAPAVVSRAPVAKTGARSLAPRESTPAAKQDADADADAFGPVVVVPEVVEQPKHLEMGEPKPPEAVPAKIVAQPQPPFPPWAKNLDVAAVVKLDSEVDENGNLGKMKLVSGPRLMERAAEEAVQLWIFEPAQTNGKPTASHMILTVEFQR